MISKFSREIGKGSHFCWENAEGSIEGSVLVEQTKAGTMAWHFVMESLAVCSDTVCTTIELKWYVLFAATFVM